MSNKDWTYGTVLENRGEKVMFVDWDGERRRMTGGGTTWFRGIRLENTRGPNKKVGALGNYPTAAFRPVEGEAR